MSDNVQPARPTLRVISGEATPEEIAAILAIVCARKQQIGVERTDPAEASIWAGPGDAHRGVRARFAASRHSWRTSYWPH